MSLPRPRASTSALAIALAALAAIRLASLGLYPLLDTTEARYGEIARKIVELRDWVTLWFDYQVPFWGKPPLSFWMTAASFKLLGVNEFAARLPHWIGGCLVAWLVWSWLARRSSREAMLAVALLSGSLMFFVSAGTVMTDMALTLGVMMAMRGFWLALHGAPEDRRREQGLFWAGLAIGLLAKGPLVLLLVGAPIAAWTLGAGEVAHAWRVISWIRGLIIVAALVVPWYAMAEARTPGFLEYFLVGEHWHRFVTPGWTGDLYGDAHVEPRGTIWLFAFESCAPWSVLLPILGWRQRGAAASASADDRSFGSYLLLWALFPCLLFTLARNILPAYVLPAMPAFAMLAALWLVRIPDRVVVDRFIAGGLVFMAVASIVMLGSLRFGGGSVHRSTKSLVADYAASAPAGAPFAVFGARAFSADFYSKGRAERVCCADALEARLRDGPLYVAVRDEDFGTLPATARGRLELVSRRGEFSLFRSSRSPEPKD